MRRVWRWTANGLGGLVAGAAIAAAVLYARGGARIDRHYDVTVAPITDSAAIARGRHLSVMPVGRFGIGAFSLPRWARQRREQMEGIAECLAPTAGPERDG